MPNAAIMGVSCIEMHPFHTQNRTHRRNPGAQRWCSRLAMDVGEGQKQTRCCGSPVRRRGDAECNENGVVLHICMEINHFHAQNRTVMTHHHTPGAQRWCANLAMDVGKGQKQTRCSGSPVQRRSDAECSDNGGNSNAPHPQHSEPDRPDPPPHSGCAKIGVLTSPWMWAKARSKRGALIRMCGDGVMPNAAIMGVFCIEMHPFHIKNRTVRTHHRTPGAQRWCSRLAMDVGKCQEQTRCIDSPVRRRGDAECSENGVVLHVCIVL
jgi:hypothetical protein